LDFNPYTGYRLTQRFSAGLGWNHRVPFDLRNRYFTSTGIVFGPRTFGDYRLGKGFIVHAEVEAINRAVHNFVTAPPEAQVREWVWNAQTGIKKEFRISNNVKGIVITQYNWVKHLFNATYTNRFNTRIGVEFKLPGKKKVE
jgi:hypothetical protein